MNKIFKNLLFWEILGMGVLGILILYQEPGYTAMPMADSNNSEHKELQANNNNANSSTKKELEAFWTSDYNYWDARLLADYWGQSTGEAKARIGRKILWGDQDVAYLEEMLENARTKRLALIDSSSIPYDFYVESGYTYDDAELLAQFWGNQSVAEAKLWIERKLTMGAPNIIEEVLMDARNRLASSNSSTETELNAFGASSYNYWDARLLADYWGQSTGEAKARIGRKILWGEQDVAYLEEMLGDARLKRLALIDSSSPPYDFYAESGYTYDDAELLAQMWGDQSVSDAKLWIERKLTMGDQIAIENALIEARNRN